jgi:hypothetical protein
MRAGKHDSVAFRITQPTFPVGVFTAMARLDDLSFHFFGSRNRGVEVQFRTQQLAEPSTSPKKVTSVCGIDHPLIIAKLLWRCEHLVARRGIGKGGSLLTV